MSEPSNIWWRVRGPAHSSVDNSGTTQEPARHSRDCTSCWFIPRRRRQHVLEFPKAGTILLGTITMSAEEDPESPRPHHTEPDTIEPDTDPDTDPGTESETESVVWV